MTTHVRQATASDLDLVVPLFDKYRKFYGHPSDPEGGRRFIEERLEHAESTIFLAFHDSATVGFTLLYPSFSSGAMARIFILNDLFVLAEQLQFRDRDLLFFHQLLVQLAQIVWQKLALGIRCHESSQIRGVLVQHRDHFAQIGNF